MLLAMINLDKWNALPKYYQNVLEQAGHYANNWMMAKYDVVNPMALRKLLAGGAKLHAFSPPVMEASFKAAKELHNEVAATNANFKKVNESLIAFSKMATSGSRSPNRLRHLHGPSHSLINQTKNKDPGASPSPGPLLFG